MSERFNSIREGTGGRSVHDVGGLDFGPIDRHEHDLALWEKRIDALIRLMGSPKKRVMSSDSMRRVIESYNEQQYDATTYYEKWTRALRNILIEQDVLNEAELARKIKEVKAAFAQEGRAVAEGEVPRDAPGDAR